ncbi:mitochondrial intermembrane space import and assembly protein 40 [Microdochium nivale]|nr:mitochondrial intermembrane space import and assembly protein 40 [Microdochium nivale]
MLCCACLTPPSLPLGPSRLPRRPPPSTPQIIPNESASSTASLIDVDTPSVHTVASDFEDHPVKTETQQARIDLEEAAHRARAEADLAKKKTAHKARRADAAVTGWFENLSDEASTALVASNFAAIIGLGSYLGYKAYGLYERGRLTGKNVAVGLGIVAAVAAFEGVFGGYLYKGKKQSKK